MMQPNLARSTTTGDNATFYTSMFTSMPEQSCKLRFFYYTNGHVLDSAKVALKVYVRLASKQQLESQPILTVPGNTAQMWIQKTASYSFDKPFQFAFVGSQNDILSRIAIDDISIDPNGCKASTVPPKTSTTTPAPQSHSTSSSRPTDTTTSKSHHNDSHSPGHGRLWLSKLELFLICRFICCRWCHRSRNSHTHSDHTWSIRWILWLSQIFEVSSE